MRLRAHAMLPIRKVIIQRTRPALVCTLTFLVLLTSGAAYATSCSTAGLIQYTGGDMEFCNGSTWISMKGSSVSSCSGTTGGDVEICVQRNAILRRHQLVRDERRESGLLFWHHGGDGTLFVKPDGILRRQ